MRPLRNGLTFAIDTLTPVQRQHHRSHDAAALVNCGSRHRPDSLREYQGRLGSQAMASNGDGFVDDSVKGPADSQTKNKKLQGPFAYEKKIKKPRDDPELSQHVFSLPVDSEHKAKAINLFSFAKPHMRSFHLNWIAFFITFFSAYGAAPLIPTIREDIGLTAYKANTAGQLISLSFCSCLASRLAS